MQVSVETTTGLERRMTVEIPEDKVGSEVDTRLKSMTQTARLPGFRPGKVPLKVVARRFGRQVRDEVVGEMIRSSFFDAISKEKLRPAGNPTFDPVNAEPGSGLSYTAVFEVYPEVSPPAVETLEVKRMSSEVADADIDRMLETLRKQRITWEATDEAATEDDRVTIDFQGYVDGEALESAKGEGVAVELNAGRMIKGFEAGLVGATTGEERELNLEFPADYHATEVAGKPVNFKVSVKTVERGVLPEVNDDFVKSFGVEDATVDAFRTEIRQNMEREMADTLTARTRESVMDALLAANPVEIPGTLVEEESRRMAEQQRAEFARQGFDASRLDIPAQHYEEPARRRVALGLLLAELVKGNDLKADPERVRAKIERLASTFEQPEQVVNWYYAERERLAEVESAVLEEQVVDWILERASVNEEKVSFDELMKAGQTSSQPSGEAESEG